MLLSIIKELRSDEHSDVPIPPLLVLVPIKEDVFDVKALANNLFLKMDYLQRKAFSFPSLKMHKMSFILWSLILELCLLLGSGSVFKNFFCSPTINTA